MRIIGINRNIRNPEWNIAIFSESRINYGLNKLTDLRVFDIPNEIFGKPKVDK